MTKRCLILVLVAAGICLLFACDEKQKEPPESAQSPGAPTAVEQEFQPSGDVSNQTVTVGGDKGGTDQIQYGGDNVSLPEGWPAFLTVYDGAKIVNSQRLERADGIHMSLGIETQDSADDLLAHYTGIIEGEGYWAATEMFVENHLIRNFSKGSLVIELQCNTEEHRTMVYLSIKPAL